jgi:hypothetical protein
MILRLRLCPLAEIEAASSTSQWAIWGILQQSKRTSYEALQVVPAALDPHRTAESFRNPGGHGPRGPTLAVVGSGSSNGLAQCLLELYREHGCRAPGRGVLPVVHPARTLLVIASRNLADPVAGIAGAVGNLFGGLPTGEQPQDLPPAAFMLLSGGAIVLFQLAG